LSFILAFGRLPAAVLRAAAAALPLLAVIHLGAVPSRWGQVAVDLGLFFTVALVCHGELARLRPSTRDLTEFYLWLSLGGMLGGAFNALLAPVLFTSLAEYPLALVFACLLAPSWRRGDSHPRPSPADLVVPVVLGVAAYLLFFASTPEDLSWRRWLAAAGCLVCATRPVRFGLAFGAVTLAFALDQQARQDVIYRERNFFGVIRVERDSKRNVHRMVHGTTIHGLQHLDELRKVRILPRLYYDATGPIGQVFIANSFAGVRSPVAVIGLGAGSLASYAEHGQEWAFFEIDPAVERIARDSQYFTYLTDSRGSIRVVIGDARLMLAHEPDRHFGVLVVDAFNSDAIPVHLLTCEALQLYRSKLAEGGVIAFHISNNYLDLEKVLDGLARAEQMVGLSQSDEVLSEAESRRGKEPSHWILLAERPEYLSRYAKDARWKPLPRRADAPEWTDDFHNILGVIRWR